MLNITAQVGLLLTPMPDDEIETIGKVYLDLVDDLHRGYGHYAAFRGYYLTQEWGWRDGDFTPARADVISQHFLGPISDRIHAIDPTLEVRLYIYLTRRYTDLNLLDVITFT